MCIGTCVQNCSTVTCHSKYQGDGPTGIILIYPQHCVHLLEAPFELINAVIIDLKELEITG